eukprot:TRINITY_DN6910_c0_g1_i1.p1 TRINITY_DN6910_c0_g1~~TRINITY_DN6910_c0_g1_i1.p1  ORF type:complete len:556 (+),score=136.19 TRINITY_DN6910_c0_g1_i1:84-1751(+)
MAGPSFSRYRNVQAGDEATATAVELAGLSRSTPASPGSPGSPCSPRSVVGDFGDATERGESSFRVKSLEPYAATSSTFRSSKWVRARNQVTGWLRDIPFVHRPLGIHGWFTVTLAELLVFGAVLYTVSLDNGEEFADSTRNMWMLVFLVVPHTSLVTLVSGISFERLIKYHTWLAYALAVPMTLHGIAHNVFTDWSDISHITGNVMFAIYMTMVVTSLPIFRRRFFEFFYFIHVPLAIAFAGLALVHHDCVWEGIWYVLVLYAADCAIRARRACKSTQVVGMRRITGIRVTELRVAFSNLKTKEKWTHHGGQFAWVNVPKALGRGGEWHPVSISSSAAQTAETGELTFHIRSMGPNTWSNDIINGKVAVGDAIRLDGPCGVCSIPYELAEQVVLVGGGIGITPMISLLGDLVAMAEATGDGTWGNTRIQGVHLNWTLRETALILYFQDLLVRALALRKGNANGTGGCNFTLSLHFTAPLGEVSEDLKLELASHIIRGRPEWEEIMAAQAAAAEGKRVAVLVCGPAPLMSDVTRAAHSANCCGSATFQVHQETFEL